MSDSSSSADDSRDQELSELWDQVRKKFATSNMVELKLSSLAQNAETDWPLDGDDETPSKYIDFAYDELKMLPELAPDPSRIQLLIEILHETLAFDTGFDDLEIGAGATDQTVSRVLKDLEIPDSYPIELTRLDQDSKELCQAEGIENVGQFAEFAQNMAQNVVIGGDFRTLVNALTQGDEAEIANYMPFRPNAKGLHLPEAFGMFIRPLGERQKLALAKRAGMKLSEEQTAKAGEMSAAEVGRLEADLHNQLKPVVLWFDGERERLAKRFENGEDVRRDLLPLNDEVVERIALHFMKILFSGKEPKETRAADAPKGGFFSRLFGRGKG